MEWLEKFAEPTKLGKQLAEASALANVNEAISLVRELRDTTILPEELPEQIQKILTALSIVKADLLVGR